LTGKAGLIELNKVYRNNRDNNKNNKGIINLIKRKSIPIDSIIKLKIG